MRKQQNIQVNTLKYLEEAMMLYGTYSADSIEERVDVLNHLHKNITKYEKILGGCQPYLYKDNIMERRIMIMSLNSLLYLHEIQMKYVNICKDLIRNYTFISMQSAFFPLVICLWV